MQNIGANNALRRPHSNDASNIDYTVHSTYMCTIMYMTCTLYYCLTYIYSRDDEDILPCPLPPHSTSSFAHSHAPRHHNKIICIIMCIGAASPFAGEMFTVGRLRVERLLHTHTHTHTTYIMHVHYCVHKYTILLFDMYNIINERGGGRVRAACCL